MRWVSELWEAVFWAALRPSLTGPPSYYSGSHSSVSAVLSTRYRSQLSHRGECYPGGVGGEAAEADGLHEALTRRTPPAQHTRAHVHTPPRRTFITYKILATLI